MAEMTRFAGKVVLVTGAGTGIGCATACAFGQEGAKVVLLDINAETAEETAHIITSGGGEALVIPTDVAEPAHVQAALQRVRSVYGRLDCAANIAGIAGDAAPITESSVENFDRVMATNVRGVWLCMKYEIPLMLEHGGGTIVNASSYVSVVGFPMVAPYVASKHAVAGLTKAAALEYTRQGIRVNSICPGPIDTPMVQNFFKDHPEAKAALGESLPIGRLGRPEEMAQAVLWLCSDASSFVVGHSLMAEGGAIIV